VNDAAMAALQAASAAEAAGRVDDVVKKVNETVTIEKWVCN
jgi:hypothetical protein